MPYFSTSGYNRDMPIRPTVSDEDLEKKVLAYYEEHGAYPSVHYTRKQTKAKTARVLAAIKRVKEKLEIRDTYSLGLILGLTMEEIEQKLKEIRDLDRTFTYSRLSIAQLRTIAFRSTGNANGTRKTLIERLNSANPSRYRTLLEKLFIREEVINKKINGLKRNNEQRFEKELKNHELTEEELKEYLLNLDKTSQEIKTI